MEGKGGRRWYIEIGREKEEWCVERSSGVVCRCVGGCRGEGSLLWKARERGVGGVGEKGVCCGRQGRREFVVGGKGERSLMLGKRYGRGQEYDMQKENG